MNKVMLIGFTGEDPQVSVLDNDLKVANFSLATSEKWTDRNGEKKEATEWHRIVCWRRLAEIVEQYVSKGQQVFVEGKIKTRSYDDQNGVKRYVTEVYATSLLMLSRKSSGENESRARQQAEAFNEMPPPNDGEDDLPL